TRTTIILPTFQIFTALGISYFLSNYTLGIKKILSTALLVLALFFFGHYLHNYYRIAPTVHAESWQYGYKQAVQASQEYYDSVEKIVVSTAFKQPQNFFAF